MTVQELIDMLNKLQQQTEITTNNIDSDTTNNDSDNNDSDNTNIDTENTNINEPQLTETGEINEPANIEPQTNGKKTDSIVAGVKSSFEEETTATETIGVEQLLSANFDERFGTLTNELSDIKIEMDKMKVALSEILTRIDLVQEVTDKVTTVDHDTLLSESIKLLI